jgi:hypothetical protein
MQEQWLSLEAPWLCAPGAAAEGSVVPETQWLRRAPEGAIFCTTGSEPLSTLVQSARLLRHWRPDFPISVYVDCNSQEAARAALGAAAVAGPGVQLVSYEPRFVCSRVECETAWHDRRILCNFFRFEALLRSPYDRTVYLDTDIFIVAPGFFAGMQLAQDFGGIAFAVQDRYFWTSDESRAGHGRRFNVGDLDIGWGTGSADQALAAEIPRYMPAVHAGLIFYHASARGFARRCAHLILAGIAMRGQSCIAHVMWQTCRAPLILPHSFLASFPHLQGFVTGRSTLQGTSLLAVHWKRGSSEEWFASHFPSLSSVRRNSWASQRVGDPQQEVESAGFVTCQSSPVELPLAEGIAASLACEGQAVLDCRPAPC